MDPPITNRRSAMPASVASPERRLLLLPLATLDLEVECHRALVAFDLSFDPRSRRLLGDDAVNLIVIGHLRAVEAQHDVVRAEARSICGRSGVDAVDAHAGNVDAVP